MQMRGGWGDWKRLKRLIIEALNNSYFGVRTGFILALLVFSN